MFSELLCSHKGLFGRAFDSVWAQGDFSLKIDAAVWG